MKTLVIVESPTKAKTISKFLGSGFIVSSSFGHVRDLPKSKMGIDIEGGTFEPSYTIPRDKAKHVKELKEKKAKSGGVIFATDEDREGEAISWHLAEILGIKPKDAQRIVFHEITKSALEEALKNPRTINEKLVDSQQTRRILDRLVGYELSPLLWKKIARGLSAGRVQSVAVRLVVERERERDGFKTQEYWTIAGEFAGHKQKAGGDYTITAVLHSAQGKKLDKFAIADKSAADGIVSELDGASYSISNINKKEAKRTPPPPFTTSTLQQVAGHGLGFSAKATMMVAQQLYEGVDIAGEGHVGLITYMRTDSVNLSEKFIAECSSFVESEYGKKYGLSAPRRYKTKSKGAQEAHEAIRPSDPARTPESLKHSLNPRQLKLYTLIWKRAVATQMAESRLNLTTIDIQSHPADYLFRATGQTMIFDGWMKLYPEAVREHMLPELAQSAAVACTKLLPEQHFTEPPARYSDATLVKALEEHGIGRPSTYAPTIATIETRGYVERDESKRFKPTDIGTLVNDVLVEHFPNIVDYNFTARMEADLDAVADGEKEWRPLVAEFYAPFHAAIVEKTEELSKKELTEEKTDEVCEKCGSAMVIKTGRFGKFIACTNYPECKSTKSLGEDGTPEDNTTDEVCEKCGKQMAIKHGRFGSFLGCTGYPECKNIRKQEKKTGVACNLCRDGEFVEKRTRKGRTFYSCNRYPECENALWSKPTGQMCAVCGAPVVAGTKKTEACSNKECPSHAAA